MSWPRQDNGTVDWEAVFEDPDIGLKAYLKGAKTIMAIGQCAHVIVQSLFTREGDLAYRIAFIAAIDEVIKQYNDKTGKDACIYAGHSPGAMALFVGGTSGADVPSPRGERSGSAAGCTSTSSNRVAPPLTMRPIPPPLRL